MDTQQSNAKSPAWQPIAASLLLAVLLAIPIVIVATMASFAQESRVSSALTANQDRPSLSSNPSTLHGSEKSFYFGYLEFDVDPSRPGGVPGFGSWPPSPPPPTATIGNRVSQSGSAP